MANKFFEADILERLQHAEKVFPGDFYRVSKSIQKHRYLTTDKVIDALFLVAENSANTAVRERALWNLSIAFGENPETAKSAYVPRLMAMTGKENETEAFVSSTVQVLNALFSVNRDAAKTEGLADLLIDTGLKFGRIARAGCFAGLHYVLAENPETVTPALVVRLEELRDLAQAQYFQQAFPDASDPKRRLIKNRNFADEILEMAEKIAREKALVQPAVYEANKSCTPSL